MNDADQEEHSHGHVHAPHVGDIEAITLRIPVLSDEMFDKLEKWLQRVLWDGLISSAIEDDSTAAEILRAKGILYREDGRRVVLQGVRDLFELKELDGGVDGQVETVGKIVLIGKAMGAVDVVQKALDGVVGR
jgi:G3E family GTPase